MSLPVSVIIAALNDERWIGPSIDSAFAAEAGEVIVVDGGSTDGTRDIALSRGARLIASPPMRSRQLNRGAADARHDALIFLHADTALPRGAAIAVLEALRLADFGGFRISFAEDAMRLRVEARLINLRSRLTRRPWGDQAQFVRRSAFLRDGGFREIPLMEDYDLAARMKRRSTLVPLYVKTSGRRFLEKGLLRTAMINWSIIARWHLGTDAEMLARMYWG